MKYTSFKYCWMRCSCHDFHKHHPRSETRWYWSQTAQTVMHSALNLCTGVPSWVICSSRLVTGNPRFSHMQQIFCPTLQDVPYPSAINPKALLYQSTEIPDTLKASWHTLLGSNILLPLMPPSIHLTFSQTLHEAPSDLNTFCWWITSPKLLDDGFFV